jgi:AAA domain
VGRSLADDWVPRLAPELHEPEQDASSVRIVPLPEFTAVEEPGVEALLGTLDQNLIPVGGDVMLYGDGGAGKTTLAIDLAFHLASGLDWLGLGVELPRTVLLIENEGPRPLFRRKLRKRFAAWDGPPLGDRLQVWEDPWAGFSFADQDFRAQLARTIFEREIDLVIAGPVTQLGMEDAGTIREVRQFAQQVALVRERSLRPVASLLVHHEAKSGRVSGAWEGVGDTLLHVSGSGHGRTRIVIQKARWASTYHAVTLKLRWAEGEAFEREEEDEDRPALVWDAIVAFVRLNGGTGWTAVEKTLPIRGDYARRRRDDAIREGVLIDTGSGEAKRGHRFELWHVDDPDRPNPLFTDSSRSAGTTGTTARLRARAEAVTEESSGRPYVSRDDSSGTTTDPGDRSPTQSSAQSSDGLDIDW